MTRNILNVLGMCATQYIASKLASKFRISLQCSGSEHPQYIVHFLAMFPQCSDQENWGLSPVVRAGSYGRDGGGVGLNHKRLEHRSGVQTCQNGGDGGSLGDSEGEEVEVSKDAVEVELHTSVGKEGLCPPAEFGG